MYHPIFYKLIRLFIKVCHLLYEKGSYGTWVRFGNPTEISEFISRLSRAERTTNYSIFQKSDAVSHRPRYYYTPTASEPLSLLLIDVLEAYVCKLDSRCLVESHQYPQNSHVASRTYGCVRILILNSHLLMRKEECHAFLSFLDNHKGVLSLSLSLILSFHLLKMSPKNFFLSFLASAIEQLSLQDGVGINIRKMKIRLDLHPVMGKEGVPVDYSCVHKTQIWREEIKAKGNVQQEIF